MERPTDCFKAACAFRFPANMRFPERARILLEEESRRLSHPAGRRRCLFELIPAILTVPN